MIRPPTIILLSPLQIICSDGHHQHDQRKHRKTPLLQQHHHYCCITVVQQSKLGLGRSSLLLSEFRGPFYLTIQRYNSAPLMTMTNVSTVHVINLSPQRTSLQRSAPSNNAASTAAASLFA